MVLVVWNILRRRASGDRQHAADEDHDDYSSTQAQHLRKRIAECTRDFIEVSVDRDRSAR